MLAKIIEWSGRNRFLVLLATLFVVVGGVVAVMKTPLDALPDLSDVQVIVYTEYPGQAHMVKDFWMPNRTWEGCNVNDPSARVLANYGASAV